MMGYSYGDTEGPIMCFNNAKNYQLGWYDGMQRDVLPMDNPWDGRLYGVADYAGLVASDATDDGDVVIKVQGNSVDYYVGFNRETGINSGTKEAGNQVTIQSRTGTGYGESELVAKLTAGNQYTIPDFGGSGKNVYIRVDTIDTSASPAFAEVTIYQEGNGGCTSDDDCDDGIGCTTNTCLSSGVCEFNDSTCPVANLFMYLLTDNYPAETSWSIVDNCNNNAIVMSGAGYTTRNTQYTTSAIVTPSQYTLVIDDAWGDGICCSYGSGKSLLAVFSSISCVPFLTALSHPHVGFTINRRLQGSTRRSRSRHRWRVRSVRYQDLGYMC
jgi:hypothetical protein